MKCTFITLRWFIILNILIFIPWSKALNKLRPKQDDRHFADDIFARTVLNEMYKFRLIFH